MKPLDKRCSTLVSPLSSVSIVVSSTPEEYLIGNNLLLGSSSPVIDHSQGLNTRNSKELRIKFIKILRFLEFKGKILDENIILEVFKSVEIVELKPPVIKL